MSRKTTVGQTPYVQQEDTTIKQPISMYEVSKEFYRMERQRTLVAARYVRNSDPSKKDSEVLKAQADALLEYGNKMGYECPDHLLYIDAISALKYPYWERPGLMNVWDDAERGEFDVVLCTEFFRLARKSSEQYAIMEYLKRFSVTVESITEKFEDTAEGRLLHAVQGFLGEVEAEKIRIRTLRGKLHRASIALTGQGSTPTYGYVWVDGVEYKKERYELNLTIIHVDADGTEWTEVKVIIYCYDSCLRGMSSRQIAFALTRMGIPTRKGNTVWNRRTVRQILSNSNYTGIAYNGRWTKDADTKKFPTQGTIKLPDGIYPRIIEPEVFEQVQRQLAVNAEMSSRNNHSPEETILRGMMYCGICERKMHVKHPAKVQSGRKTPRQTEYECNTNDGIDDLLHHHFTTITARTTDESAWVFAVPYIKNAQRIREHVIEMRKQVVKRDQSQDLETELNRINDSIANLFALVEVADPADKEGMQAFQQRLIVLQKDKREKERLLSSINVVEEKQEKLLASLDRFEAWAERVRPFLDDPTYTISQQDKISALLILGVKATVWPLSGGFEERLRFKLAPPDIARFCDFDFGR